MATKTVGLESKGSPPCLPLSRSNYRHIVALRVQPLHHLEIPGAQGKVTVCFRTVHDVAGGAGMIESQDMSQFVGHYPSQLVGISPRRLNANSAGNDHTARGSHPSLRTGSGRNRAPAPVHGDISGTVGESKESPQTRAVPNLHRLLNRLSVVTASGVDREWQRSWIESHGLACHGNKIISLRLAYSRHGNWRSRCGAGLRARIGGP